MLRPTTQRLDKIHPKLKYFASGNEVFSQAAIALPLYSFTKSTVYSDFMFIQNPFCLSFLLICSRLYASYTAVFNSEHHRKGYIEDNSGNKVIISPFNYLLENLSKKARLLSLFEGGCKLATGVYLSLFEKDFSHHTYSLVSDGVASIRTSLGTYLVQADDDKPRPNKELFKKTKRANLEGLLGDLVPRGRAT